MRKVSLLFAAFVFLFAIVGCAPSATLTPLPPTPDARATETQIAKNIFATQTASVPTATNTPTNTATPTVTNTLLPTSTPKPSPTIDPVADRMTFGLLDERALKKNPDSFIGTKSRMLGLISSIKESNGKTTFRMSTWDNITIQIAVNVNYPGKLPNLYEKDTVIVYGRVAGSSSGEPLINAQYVDYGNEAFKSETYYAKNVPVSKSGEWEITYVGEFRDKSLGTATESKNANGIWATIQMRVKNIQADRSAFGSAYRFSVTDQSGKVYADDLIASKLAAQYCECAYYDTVVIPGEEIVIAASFDVPETTKELRIGPRASFSSDIRPYLSYQFLVSDFDQVPPRKMK
jgi:cytochrome c-type biogenesis protein CcmE